MMKNLCVKSLVVAGMLAITMSSDAAMASGYHFPTGQPVPPPFQGIINALRTATANVPLLLPTNIVGGPDTIVGQIIAATTTNYTVQISMGAACPKAMYCRFGTIHGELISAITPPLTGTQVTFEPGIIGYYTAATCSANCNESILGFDYNGSQYTVGIEAGTQADVLTTAQSLAQY